MNRLLRLGLVGILVAPRVGVMAVGAGPALAAPLTCQPSTALPTNTYPGSTVVADSFESGTLATPWVVSTGGTAA